MINDSLVCMRVERASSEAYLLHQEKFYFFCPGET